MKLFLWFLMSYGATQIIVESVIFAPIRDWVFYRSTFVSKLVNCMLCCGFWVSVLVSFVVWSPTLDVFTSTVIFTNTIVNSIIFAVLDGFVGSSIIWFFHLIDRKLS